MAKKITGNLSMNQRQNLIKRIFHCACLQMKQMSHYLILLGTSILNHLGNTTFMSHCVENIEPSRKSHQLELKQKIVIS